MAIKTRVYDISPEVSEETAVFPGDISYKRSVSLDFKHGHNLVLSAIESTVHVGAHTDAPIHYNPDGEGMSERSLDYYWGSCQVIEVNLQPGERILSKHLSHHDIRATRILFKTKSFPDPSRWNGEFNSLSAELVEFLAKKGVVLLGIDTPSIDLSEDKVLESHQAVFRNNMAILEGIVLDDVKDGIYTLVALPLKLKNADASPVRAILIEGESPWKN